MPFTPLHFGPGLFAKAVEPRNVSLSAFIVTQVVVDLEPLYFILRGEYPVHRWAHTVWAAGVIGIAVGAALSKLAQRRLASAPSALRADLGMGAALVGGFIGGVSHPVLDGLMHRDVRALRPLSEATWVLESEDIASLHIACLVAGALGVVWLMVRRARA